MRRREFITLLGGVAATSPLAAQAQRRNNVHRLGALMATSPTDAQGQARAAALVQGLTALGWQQGSNLGIDWRWTGAGPALVERYAVELVALGPDVLLAMGSTAVETLRRQTGTIPIVFVNVNDPVGQGFVARLTRPGGTITGFSNYDPPMTGKWLGMLTQISPRVERLAVIFNPATAPYAGLMMRAIESAAPSFAIAARAAPCRDDKEIAAAVEALARENRGGLLIMPDAFTLVHRDAIVALAAQHRVPAVYPYRLFATIGGLISYGIDQDDLFRRAAAYVDLIFKGTKPGDLPIQRPTKFELVINLKTAKALDITLAPSLLGTADAVIE